MYDEMMFPQANVTVREIIQMVNAIFLRFSLPIVVRAAILQLVQLLAGPRFEGLQFSKYHIAKVCDPPAKIIKHNFFCPKFYTLLTSTPSNQCQIG